MSKKHIFLSIFSKITIFACVFCVFSACAETTTCDINYTPVTGNSIQNGTPTPTNPVAIESIGTKVGNKYAVQVAVNYDGGVVDLGTLNWSFNDTYKYFWTGISDKKPSAATGFCIDYGDVVALSSWGNIQNKQIGVKVSEVGSNIAIKDNNYTNGAEFKSAMSGVMLYYQRATDETWTAPTLRTVYLDEPLRKVGNYADVLDYKTGTITRNVGVKVLDGTEDWDKNSTANYYRIAPSSIGAIADVPMLCSHFIHGSLSKVGNFNNGGTFINFHQNTSVATTTAGWKTWLASEYAAGTPVTIYYPLATPVVGQIENWSCPVPITDIKIATTKMVDDEFAQAEANLAATVQTIESVVSRTITQTGQIATLHETKQTRPDESCPANMKCLLVQDEDGTPHWYPIIEP